MKKFLLSILFIGALSNAQTVIFDQMDNATTGIVSTMLNNGENAVWSSDDFEVSAPYQLTKITVRGFQNAGTFEDLVQGLRFYIYTNNNGKPSGDPTSGGGTALLSFSTDDLDHPNIDFFQEGVTVEIMLDVLGLGQVVNLEANTKYWLVAAPKLNLTTYDASARFNWFAAAEASGSGTDAQLIDPFGAFGAIALTWTSCVTLVNDLAFKSLAFALEGQTLSTDSNDVLAAVSVFPNPVTDVLNINLNNGFDNVSFNLVDINGRTLFSGQTDAINMSGFNAGVYMLNIVQDGVNMGSKKIIKK